VSPAKRFRYSILSSIPRLLTIARTLREVDEATWQEFIWQQMELLNKKRANE